MTTNPALRDVLSAFRSMVRARGPRECLEVAAIDVAAIVLTQHQTGEVCVFSFAMPRLAARAALRWWRWASKDTSRYARVFNK